MRRCAFVATILVAGVLPAAPARAAHCTVRVGQAVQLRASDFDPDVFVWDTQGRAIAYVTRLNFVKVDDVLRHAVLAKGGTQAVVLGCNARTVRPLYSGVPEDVILVRVASGPRRGRLGWVTSSDVQVSKYRSTGRTRRGAGGSRRA